MYGHNRRVCVRMHLDLARAVLIPSKLSLPGLVAYEAIYGSDIHLLERYDHTTKVFVNGKFCKDPKLVTANDFFYSGLNIPGNTNNPLGASVTDVNVRRIPGLNTLGVIISRLDFSPGGQLSSHIHPRASQLILVLKGELSVGFVSSNEYNYKLFSKVLYPGDVFVFPIGLVQFHANNNGKKNAVAIGVYGSQNPGVIPIGNAVFGSNPLIDPKLLAKAFALDVNTVRHVQRVFSSDDYIAN